MKLGITKEGKTPPDERVPLTPEHCRAILQANSGIEFLVQRSPIRCFPDSAYAEAGCTLVDGLEKADVILGVKEVPINMLIPEKTYFFFSHTIKKQPYNRNLLRAVLEKNIRLIDWECLTDGHGQRLIGFGRYAGIVGCYNGLRAFGLREKAYSLKPAHECRDRVEVEQELKKVSLPPVKVLLTGRGRVSKGAMEILDHIGIRKVEKEEILQKSFTEPVYCQITFHDYFIKKDKTPFDSKEFFHHPERFESNFMPFAKVADVFIAGHFWASSSPFLFTREDARDPGFRIKTVADISCDIDGPVASTIRPSTIENPLYGYDPKLEMETSMDAPGAITVMAVDNLPCELPKDASTDFGNEFIRHVFSSLLNSDQDDILQRGTIAQKGMLAPDFTYLQDYVDGKTE